MQVADLLHRRTGGVEELLGTVAAQPVIEHLAVLGIGTRVCERHLVGAPEALHLHPVELFRTGPALGRAAHEHRPRGTASVPATRAPGARLILDVADAVEAGLESLCES